MSETEKTEQPDGASACPNPELHGNPFRYCPSCDWIEQVEGYEPDSTRLMAAPNAMVWAEEFVKQMTSPGAPTLDESLMLGWFANIAQLAVDTAAREMNRRGNVRRFYLHRSEDASGVSGTGEVADGAVFADGTAVVRWRGEHQTTAVHDGGMDSVEAIHGHGGKTAVVWLDDPFDESGEPDRCDFGVAIGLLKRGYRLTRSSWNGAGQSVALHPGYEPTVVQGPNSAAATGLAAGEEYRVRPYLMLRTVDSSYVPWAPSVSDALADDWQIVDAPADVDE